MSGWGEGPYGGDTYGRNGKAHLIVKLLVWAAALFVGWLVVGGIIL